ncbi:MAG: tRNA dihydrouridine synthase DusB [Calditrichia bacterium]|nr:tRNA dihydrouridine synthase DusB [Calditrichia bacterium]
MSTSYLKSLKIGNLKTSHNLVLAPLAGISNYPFRQICREFGADLTFTEMVSVDGLLYQNESSLRFLKIYSGEQPIGFQFFGSNPDLFKKMIPLILPLQPALIDINFGCPVRKVVAKGAGAALLHDLGKMEKIVSTVKSACSLPVTAKIRIGWDQENIVVKEAALAVAAGGADAITVHARTRNQGYSGKASWEYIAEVKENLKIPVIGNGDVFDGISAYKMFQTTAVDGIMLARGVLGRPWIFRDIINYLQTQEKSDEPPMSERFKILEKHYRMEVSEFGEEHALPQMRKHFAWYTHGLPNAAKLRNHIFRAKKFSEIQKIFSGYQKNQATHETNNFSDNRS